MPPLKTSALSTEVLESALLALEQIATRLTVLALNASRNPEQSQRVRLLPPLPGKLMPLHLDHFFHQGA
jgi:hypothetical protein